MLLTTLHVNIIDVTAPRTFQLLIAAVPFSVAMASTIAVATPVAIAIAMRVAVFLILSVVIAVVVAVLVPIPAAAELFLPAAVSAPVGTFSPHRQRSTISKARIKTAIEISAESFGAMEPRSGADKDASLKPLRAIVAKRSAAVRCVIEITIRAHRFRADVYGNVDLRTCLL